MKDVIIDIKGKQMIGSEEDVIELTTVGKMNIIGKKIYLRYDDNTSVENNTVKCTIKVDRDDESVVMQRAGVLNSRMYIKKGQRHICHYETGQGMLTMGIFGEKIREKLDDEGGTLSLCYTIDVNYGMLSRNEVEINIKTT